MLSHDLQLDSGILVLRPDGPLETSDFKVVRGLVNAYLARNGSLRGVLVHAEQGFPGWKDFAALVAHLKFVRDHHRGIERVAVLADGGVASVLPSLASHFIAAEVRHFDLADENAAMDWLAQDSAARIRTAA